MSQAFFLQFGKDEAVYRVLHPRLALGIIRNSWPSRHFKRPMRTVDSTLLDPLLENRDLACADRLGLTLSRLRHEIFRIFGFNPLDQLALLRVTRNDSVAMAFALLHRPFSQVKPQACFAHLRVGTVTSETTAGQDGLHILIEIEVSRDAPSAATDS